MISVQIHGMDELLKELDDAQQAIQSLDGTLAQVSFDPENEHSVSAAIQQVEAAIDDKTRAYRNNDLVQQLVKNLKAAYRAELLQRAAAERDRSTSAE